MRDKGSEELTLNMEQNNSMVSGVANGIVSRYDYVRGHVTEDFHCDKNWIVTRKPRLYSIYYQNNYVVLTKGKFIYYTMAEIIEMQWYQDIFDRPSDVLI